MSKVLALIRQHNDVELLAHFHLVMESRDISLMATTAQEFIAAQMDAHIAHYNRQGGHVVDLSALDAALYLLGHIKTVHEERHSSST